MPELGFVLLVTGIGVLAFGAGVGFAWWVLKDSVLLPW